VNSILTILLWIIISTPALALESEIIEVNVLPKYYSESKSGKQGPSSINNKWQSSKEEGHKLILQGQNEFKMSTDIIEDVPSIQQSMDCSNCGSKKITLNGLKSEMATILIDGIPIFSSLSEKYGIDAIPMEIVESINIESHQSVQPDNFESLAGALNFVTKNKVAKNNQSSLYLAGNNLNDHSVSYNTSLATKIFNLNTEWWVGASRKYQGSLDLDNNNIAEFPDRAMHQAYLKNKWHLEQGTFSFYTQFSNLQTIGGNTKGIKLAGISDSEANSDDFINSDVRNKFTGDWNKISDLVKLQRLDSYLKFEQMYSADLFIDYILAFSQQKQNSYSIHQYDYRNSQNVYYLKMSPTWFLGAHELRLKLESRIESLNSYSHQLYIVKNPPILRDDLNYRNFSISLLDDYAVTNKLQFIYGIKIEKMIVDWLYVLRGREIDHWNLNPSIAYQFELENKVMLSQSLGWRTRAPLLQLESVHGSHHYGYVNYLSKPERNIQLSSRLEKNQLKYSWFFENQINWLHDLSSVVDRSQSAQESLFQHAGDHFIVLSNQWGSSYQFNPNWSVDFSFFNSFSQNKFKKIQRLPIVEKKIQLNTNYHLDRMGISLNSTWVGALPLSLYGYDKHFNVVREDLASPEPYQFSSPKKQTSEAYFMLDLMFNYKWNQNINLDLSIKNLLNYTQTISAADSPTAWAKHGGHYHLDNMHVWGPVRPREFHIGIAYKF